MGPMSDKKIYLGDSVYGDIENGMVALTTENGVEVGNKIYLEPQVVEAFIGWLRESKLIK